MLDSGASEFDGRAEATVHVVGQVADGHDELPGPFGVAAAE